MKRLLAVSSVLTVFFLLGCETNSGQMCTDDERLNVCVQNSNLDTNISLIRERRSGAMDSVMEVLGNDTLSCFGELAGQEQRVLFIQNEIKIDSTDWFVQESDGCHGNPVHIQGSAVTQE